jgi:hypothetical protein
VKAAGLTRPSISALARSWTLRLVKEAEASIERTLAPDGEPEVAKERL